MQRRKKALIYIGTQKILLHLIEGHCTRLLLIFVILIIKIIGLLQLFSDKLLVHCNSHNKDSGSPEAGWCY